MTQGTSLRKKRLPTQWIVLGFALFAFGGLLVLNLCLNRQRTEAAERERLATQARVVEKNLALNLSSVNRVLCALQRQRSRPGSDYSRELKTLTAAMPGVRTLAILDAGGTLIASNRGELVGRNFAYRDYFQVPRARPDADTLFVSPPFTTALGVFALAVTRMVPGPHGEFAGVVTAILDPAYFATLLSSVLYTPDMWTAIAHSDGTPFMLMPRRKDPVGGNLAKPDTFFSRHLASGRELTDYAGSADLTGEKRMLVWCTIRPAVLHMDRPLLVAVSRDLDRVYLVWRNQMVKHAALWLLVALFSAAGMHRYRKRQQEFERQVACAAFALRESAERLQLATGAAGIGVWELELASQGMTWSEPMYAMYGLPGDRALSRESWLALIHPDDLARVEEELQAHLEQGEPKVYDFRIVRPDGGVRCLRAKAQVCYDAQQCPARVVGVCFDVTDSLEAESRMVEAKKQADAASKAKSAFLANMSHEIRTPMNAILGLISLLQKTVLNRRQCDYVDKVQDAATSLLDILNDILDFSKVEAGRMELERVSFRLDDLLRNLAVILCANSQEKDIEVVFAVAPEVPDLLVGDPLRLQQVLINLAGNAVKFTEEGEVVLSVSRVAATAERVELAFAIADTGIGIGSENLDRIFEGFTQAEASTSRRFGGTGLGLAISSRLVRLMGGEIEVESWEGSGSVFGFTVGFGLQQAGPVRSFDRLAGRSRPLHVLVADDNPAALSQLAGIVRSLGWSADLADDGKTALEQAADALARGRRYDAAFIDWSMPGLDGLETCRRLRELCRGEALPVVLMVTSFGREAMAGAVRQHPGLVDGFLMKPATHSTLLDAVADATRIDALMPRSRDEDEPRRPFLGLRILLVEDNKINQFVAREMLEGGGAQVTVADNGQEAVDLIRREEVAFDAVLMDVQMPVMDGYQATREMRCLPGGGDLPILAMTANAFDTDRLLCLEAGMNDHLTKPIEVRRLVQALGRYRRVPEPPATPVDAAALDPLPAEEPELPGCNVSGTLKRLNGNRQLYGQIARMACTKYARAGQEVAELLAAGDTAQARQLLHTFKGVVVNLGAQTLAEFIGTLEKALAEGAKATRTELLTRFDLLVAEAIGSLRIVADRFGQQHAPPKTASELPSPPSPLGQLGELTALLEQSNMGAVYCFVIFSARLDPAHAQRLAPIGEAIEQLDFPGALRLCSALVPFLEEVS